MVSRGKLHRQKQQQKSYSPVVSALLAGSNDLCTKDTLEQYWMLADAKIELL